MSENADTAPAPQAPRFQAAILRLFKGDEGLADLAFRAFGPNTVEQAPQLGDGGRGDAHHPGPRPRKRWCRRCRCRHCGPHSSRVRGA